MAYQIVITVFSDEPHPEMKDINVHLAAPGIDDFTDRTQMFGRILSQELSKVIPEVKEEWTKKNNEIKQFLADYEAKTGEKL